MTAPMTNLPVEGPENRPVYLIFEFERRAYPIGGEPFTIGRAGSCDVVIREPAVSRVHAELTRHGEAVTLRPFGSMPTIVNGLPAPGDVALQHGDEVNIGSATLTFNSHSLPLGVSVVDKTRPRLSAEDVANRRPTITNPLMAGHASPNQSAKQKILRPTVLMGILAAVAAYYFFGALLG